MLTISAPRYAAVTSTLALLVALGGTSYAAVQIGTKDLANGAVTSAKIRNGAVATSKLKNDAVGGSKIKDNAVTGADVRESTLARVPNADAAQRAADADTVDGTTVKVVDDSQGAGPGRPHFVYNSSGLVVELSCVDIGGGNYRVGLTATTNRSTARIATVRLSDNGSAAVEDDLEDGDFKASFGPFDLLAGDDGDVAQITFTYSDSTGSVVQGTLVSDVTTPSTEPCYVSGFIVAR